MLLRDFLRTNVTSSQLKALQSQIPELVREIDHREVDDRDFVLRVIHHDESALWLLWFCLHSSFFVRVIRVRSKHECAEPCALVEFKQLPCRWSARVIGEYFHHLIRAHSEVLESFCSADGPTLGIMDVLAVELHDRFHVEMLGEHGFGKLKEGELPESLRKLFQRDRRFEVIFKNRWLWGITELEVIAAAVVPELPTETLTEWIQLVDAALLLGDDPHQLWVYLQAQYRKRIRSGLPVRTVLPV